MIGRKTSIAELQQHYESACGLDSKPEKGERKIADDFVILINEQAPKETTADCLYLLALNQHALSLSPYNFDIKMWNLKLFDKLGMSLSWQQQFNDMDLKSVQLESLGYLYVTHSLRSGAFE